MIDVFSLEEVLLEFGFGDQIGRFVVKLAEHTHRAGVGLLGGFSFPVELQSSDHSLIPIVHKSSPSKKDRRPLSKNDDGGIGIEWSGWINCRAAAYLNQWIETGAENAPLTQNVRLRLAFLNPYVLFAFAAL